MIAPMIGQRTIAYIPCGKRGGEAVIALGSGTLGVRMMAVVGLVPGHSVYVRGWRWRRYAETSDRRSKLTGFGDARDL